MRVNGISLAAAQPFPLVLVQEGSWREALHPPALPHLPSQRAASPEIEEPVKPAQTPCCLTKKKPEFNSYPWRSWP